MRSRLKAKNGFTSEKREPPDDQTIRWFLVRWTVVFMLLALIGYFFTQSTALLLTGTVIWIAVSYVYAFYFVRR